MSKEQHEELRGPIVGHEHHRFVRGYKANSQMNVNHINPAGEILSAYGDKAIDSIYEGLMEEDSDFPD